MTRIYDNSGFKTRMNVSCVVIVIAALFGCWELWTAYRSGGESGMNYLFALFFIGGAIYAANQIRDTAFDSVVTFDADLASGTADVVMWRPFSEKRIAGPLGRFTDWQFQMKTGRARTPILTVHHPEHPRPLELELRPGVPVSKGLRSLAPDAVAAFERGRTAS